MIQYSWRDRDQYVPRPDSLIRDMIYPDPSKRPSSERVRDTTAWLTVQSDAVPTPIDEHCPDINPTIARTIMQCISASADRRPASAEVVVKMLRNVTSDDK